MSLIKTVNLNQLGDERGALIAIEQNNELPFDIKRVYYIYNTKGNTPRGFHAHRELEQFAVCVSGSCRMLLDNGCTREEVLLCNPEQGVLIEKMVWHEMHDFSDDCMLLVLASDAYNESDYIRNYDKFCIEQGKHNG